ncbi:MAG: deoxyribodipyrimidine photo-lyase, partial [Idiomarina sp.]|nr:deoxyribodipyrimidine photo-lyase [Idiomarina sp.]
MKKAIWFRSDLRTLDNEALYLACQSESAPEAIFLVCEDTWQRHHWAPIKQDFLWRTLEVLNKNLSALGIKLHIKNAGRFSNAGGALREFCKEHS